MTASHDGHARGPGNHLVSQTSPYLQQHAHNPVDWYPWGAEAFARAQREHKPIHLSIGYAACHWCHVMAHESFEDPDTAQVLNELFINIKVDREERPDVDRIYQIAQQMLTQRSGGWPLTMFLTHDDQRPFFGGTYFPKEARHGLPAFQDLLRRVAGYYREHAPQLRQQNDALMRAFADLTPPPAGSEVQLSGTPLRNSREQLQRSFDSQYGGFGRAPKFPHPRSLTRLLRDWHATSGQPEPDLQALYMATLTAKRMGEGGINDQLGGGFSRYSVDDYWMIPHFEKMLYDNGELLAVYAETALATGDGFYAGIAASTAEWALREMRAPQGGFYSSYDADSEGHEGKFYVWDRAEVERLLEPAEYAAFAPRFGLNRPANFEGRWHLHVFESIDSIAGTLACTGAEVSARLESARRKLLAQRNRRIWPGRDDKILTSWNALMIRGLAMSARALERADFAQAAGEALQFVRSNLWQNGRLLATCKDGHAHLNAYLDDYVYLVDAILELQQVRFRMPELAFAIELTECVLQHFADPAGGFFFTSDDHEVLIHRSKTFADDATPSGNGIAAYVLQRLGHLLGENRYLAAAEQTLRAAWGAIEQFPQAHTTLLLALEELLHPPQLVILRGSEAALSRWASDLGQLYAPRRMVLAIPRDTQGLPAALADKAGVPERDVVAYVCEGSVCSAPLDALPGLLARLRAGLS
ncbi:MAG: thioredoxin domain-containing protein [Sinobacteraceae bacterium]|nr:thioredoxin domain-containing protein [Nevskiaceae bacterium]